MMSIDIPLQVHTVSSVHLAVKGGNGTVEFDEIINLILELESYNHRRE